MRGDEEKVGLSSSRSSSLGPGAVGSAALDPRNVTGGDCNAPAVLARGGRRTPLRDPCRMHGIAAVQSIFLLTYARQRSIGKQSST